MTAGRTESDCFRLRPCEASDREAVYEVCLKTGDGGEDATDLHTDPKALGHIYVGPYMRLEPLLAFVLEDEVGVCGYVLGALESERFYRRYAEEWLPSIRAAIRIPTGAPEGWSQTERIYHQLLEPRPHYPKKLRGYPSHLHIDLLPRAQGRGWGARMMGRLMNELAALGSSGDSNSPKTGFWLCQ